MELSWSLLNSGYGVAVLAVVLAMLASWMFIKRSHTNSKKWLIGSSLVFALIIAFAVGSSPILGSKTTFNAVGGASDSGTSQVSAPGTASIDGVSFAVNPADCSGITGSLTLTYNVYNKLNTTGSETFDTGYEVYGNNGLLLTGTDSTAGSLASTFYCNKVYKAVGISADGAGGDNSNYLGYYDANGKIQQDSPDMKVQNGAVYFKVTPALTTLNLLAEQHATLKGRLYDNKNTRFSYQYGVTGTQQASGLNTTAYLLTGKRYTDGTNSTAYTVGTNDYQDFTLQLQSAQVDSNFVDSYAYVLFNGTVSDGYNIPTGVTFGPSGDASKIVGLPLAYGTESGTTTNTLGSDENVQLTSTFPAIFKITSAMDPTKTYDLHWRRTSTATNPTKDYSVVLKSAGHKLAINGQSVINEVVDDTASHSAIFTQYEAIVDNS